MTLTTLKHMLEVAEKKGDTEQVSFLKAKIEQRLKHPKYKDYKVEEPKEDVEVEVEEDG